jgi:predicted enzyme related to lactoylglutathione lyase
MAKRKSIKRGSKKVAKKVAKKRPVAKRSRRAVKPARKAAPRKPAAARAPAPPSRIGVITHTELASADPAATKAWCEKVLDWQFMQAMPTPAGPYHMWQFAIGTGGGIRANNPPEVPGSIPYCEVKDIQDTFARALAAGATEMLGPMALPGGMGWIAIVAAPGGVAIGFWAAG